MTTTPSPPRPFWKNWMAWFLPLAGYASALLGVAIVLGWPQWRMWAFPLLALGVVLLIAGMVAIVVVQSHSRRHGGWGVAAFFLGGPAMALSVLMVSSPQARQDLATTIWRMRQDWRASSETEGQALDATEVRLQAVVPQPEPFAKLLESKEGLSIFKLDVPLGAAHLQWTADSDRAYITASSRLFQIKASTRQLENAVELPSNCRTCLTAAGMVVLFSRGPHEHLFVLLDPEDLPRGREVSVPRHYLITSSPSSPLFALQTPDRELTRVYDLKDFILSQRRMKGQFQASDIEQSIADEPVHGLAWHDGKLWRQSPARRESVSLSSGASFIHAAVSPNGRFAIARANNSFYWVEVMD